MNFPLYSSQSERRLSRRLHQLLVHEQPKSRSPCTSAHVTLYAPAKKQMFIFSFLPLSETEDPHPVQKVHHAGASTRCSSSSRFLFKDSFEHQASHSGVGLKLTTIRPPSQDISSQTCLSMGTSAVSLRTMSEGHHTGLVGGV